MFWTGVVMRLGLGGSALVIGGFSLLLAPLALFYAGPGWAGFLLILGVVMGVAGVWELVRLVRSLRARLKRGEE